MFLMRAASTAAPSTPPGSAVRTPDSASVKASCTPRMGTGSARSRCLLSRKAPISSSASSWLLIESPNTSSGVFLSNLARSSSSNRALEESGPAMRRVFFSVPRTARMNVPEASSKLDRTPKPAPSAILLARLTSGESPSSVAQSLLIQWNVLGNISFNTPARLSPSWERLLM